VLPTFVVKKRKTADAIKMRKKAKKQQDGGSSVLSVITASGQRK